MSLYRKYRPKTFGEMIGNKDQIESLKSILDKKETHSFLFTGEAGTGKTTAARICAQLLNGSDMSIMEINSANNRGIDTARMIIETLHMTSIDGKTTIYIIDEIHMTSKDFQNAMLKPLEDTPNHVYFFLCTTNPEKLIAPLKSRCSLYKFNPLEYKQIERLLNIVNRKEQLKVSKEIIEEIGDSSKGVPRTALVMLEMFTGMDEKEAMQLLSNGLAEDNKEIIALCRELLSKETSWKNITIIIKQLAGEDIEKIRHSVMGYMGSVLLSGKNNQAAKILDMFSEPFYNTGRNGLILACYNSIYL